MTIHAAERAEERYNTELTKNDLLCMEANIQLGQAFFYHNTRDNGQVYYVKYNKIPYKVVYDLKTRRIVTCLPFVPEEYNLLVEQKKELERMRKEQDIQNAINFLKKYKYIVYRRGIK